MDRTKYQDIRQKFNLSQRQGALAIHWMQNGSLLIIVAGLYTYCGSARFVGIPLIASFIFRNFSMMHEAVHRAANRNNRINDWSGIIAGAICLLPFEPWRKSHLEHHLWSGNIDRDPVMAIIRIFPKMPSRLQKMLSFFWQIWFPMLACIQYVVFWALAFQTFVKKPDSPRNLASLVSPLIAWGLAIAITPATFSYEILAPAVFLYFLAVEVVNFPHHLQLPQFGGDTKFPIWEQHRIARSCVYPKWFGRLVALNFNYHIEHHMFPDVAWYHLDRLHVLVKSELGFEYNTDTQFSWILENKPKCLEDVLKSAQPAITAPHRVA